MRSLVSILAWGALLACAAIAPANAGQVANLEKLIAGLRELEAAQNRLMNDLSRGVVVMDRLSDGNGFFAIRTAEIREAFRLRIAAEESAKSSPNLDAAEARVTEGANRYIAARRADSRSYMGRLTAELSRVRTARQKAERQRDLLKAQANVPGASSGSFGGTWTSGWGKMVLTQSGSRVTGAYEHSGGKLEGDVGADGKLRFRWSQANGNHGIGEFALSADGKTFTGTWHYTDKDGAVLSGAGGTWAGSRAGN